MSEKELQEVNRKEALRKAVIGNGVMLFVLAVVIILAVFAWITFMGSSAKYGNVHLFTQDDRDIRYVTQAGTLAPDGQTIVFSGPSMNDENASIPTVTLLPGDTVYFKTTIKNYDTHVYTGTLVLQGMLVNKRVFDSKYQSASIVLDEHGNKVYDYQRSALSFGAEAKFNGASLNPHLGSTYTYTDPATQETTTYDIEPLSDHSYYLADPQIHKVYVAERDEYVEDDTYYYVNTQNICADILLPGATDATHPGTFYVVWEFKVSGKLANASDVEVEEEGGQSTETQESEENLMGQDLLEFGSMRFIVDNNS